MRDALLEWKDVTGDKGNLQIPYDDASIISISLYDNSDDTEVHACHDLDIPTARALHEALGRALEEVDPRPVIDSISTTLAACSAPVPDILLKIDAACGESHLVNVVHGPDGTRVYRTPGTLRGISVEELAKLGLKPKAHLPSDGYLLECGHWSIHKQWCTECAADIVAISQRASHPEPAPTGNGASTLHPRPFFWDGDGFFGFVNHFRLPPAERHDLDWLLTAVPNALDAKEADGSALGIIPGFGFRPHHTGPRTLREYLEAP